jgi:hypothetical protein
MEVSGQLYTAAAVPSPGKQLPVQIEKDAGWAAELIWTFRKGDYVLPLQGDRFPGFSRPQLSHYTD